MLCPGSGSASGPPSPASSRPTLTSHARLAQTSRERMTSVMGSRHPDRTCVFTRVFGQCKPIYLCHSDPTDCQAISSSAAAETGRRVRRTRGAGVGRSLLSTRALLIGVEIVMTPLRSRQEHRSVIRVERVSSDKLNSDRIHYIAGGSYCGIVVNRAVNGTPFLLSKISYYPRYEASLFHSSLQSP